jgi:putative ABC transport system ATP-binding protein
MLAFNTAASKLAGTLPGMKPAATPAIIADRLTKTVRDADGILTILDSASFSAEAGESIAVIGPSGSGKSTLLGLLAGLDQASPGKIQLLGDDLTAMDEEARAKWRSRRVGFVFQSFQLLPNLTALENVLLPLELVGTPDPMPRAHALLGRVGLAQRAAPRLPAAKRSTSSSTRRICARTTTGKKCCPRIAA